jgi:HSP20 family protein
MTLVKFNPIRDLINFEREINKMFNEFDNLFGLRLRDVEDQNLVWMPSTDIAEYDDRYEIKMDFPGLTKEDVKISYNDGQLTISGERKFESDNKDVKYHRIERSYGKFFRSFSVPNKIKEDKIEANFKDGLLTIILPKAEEAKPKEIEIKIS